MLRGMDLSTRARRRIATALALLLAVESVTAVTVAAATLPMATSSEAGPVAATLSTCGPPHDRARGQLPRPGHGRPAVAFVPIDLPEVVAPTPAPDPAPAPRRHALPEGLPSAVAAPAATPPRPTPPPRAGAPNRR